MRNLLANVVSRLIGRRRRRSGAEIAPDEVLIDASNLPAFDHSQFEGRIEHPIRKRALFGLSAVGLMVMLGFLMQTMHLQVVSGEHYAAVSANNRLERSTEFAARGAITDRHDSELAWNVPADDLPFPRREYTNQLGLSHLLGYLNYPAADQQGNFYRTDYVGRAGVEATFDAHLNGDNGVKLVEKTATGKVSAESVTAAPTDGTTLHLAVDAALQQQLYTHLRDAMDKADFVGGAGVIMDVRSGEVLAMASAPSYDPDVMTAGTSSAAIRRYVDDAKTPFLNRSVSGLYTPGSVIKPVVAAAALEEGIISPETNIRSDGELIVENPYDADNPAIFKDWKVHGLVDMREALAVSSNEYFYTIGGGHKDQEGLGISRINRYASAFGYGTTTGVALPGEQAGVVPNPQWKRERFNGADWHLGDTYNTAIGQFGFQVTPLQVARTTAAIANGGELLTPVLRSGGETSRTSVSVSEESLGVVREGMRQVVATSKGTASFLNTLETPVAAKTGTAEVGPNKEQVNSWITGFFPYEEPRYAFAVVLSHGPAGSRPASAITVTQETLQWLEQHRPEYVPTDAASATE